MNSLLSREPVKGITDKGRNVGKLRNVTYKPCSSIKDSLKFVHIGGGKANVHSITKVNPSADQSVDQCRDSMK